jgi:hypothetical protein
MATTTSGVSPVGNKFYTTTVTTNTDGSLKSVTSRTDASGKNGVPVSSVTILKLGDSPSVHLKVVQHQKKRQHLIIQIQKKEKQLHNKSPIPK